MPSIFKFQATKCHLTFKTHIDHDAFLHMLEEKGMKPKYYSFVHENGDTEEENPTPYEHTHVALMWRKKQDRAGEDLFDYGDIHPNIQVKRSLRWMQHIFQMYHKGHKVKADGKKYHIEPVALWQAAPPNWEGDIWDAIAGCTSLKDGCEMIDAIPKSIADVKTIQGATVSRGLAKVEDDCEGPWAPAPPEWNPKKRSLVIVGVAGNGKTNWARHWFKDKAYEIDTVEDLKHVPQNAEGLIFDDQAYAKKARETQIKLADPTKGASIRARHNNAYKPHLPAIYTTNNLDELFDMTDRAIARRLHVWRVDWNEYESTL